jgi:AraC-like DNA-binding protein
MPGAERPATAQRLLAEAERVISQAYGDPDLTLSDVASEVGVSPRQLQRIFRELKPLTFRASLERVRMTRARELLLMGYSSRRVAEHVGYRGAAGFR